MQKGKKIFVCRKRKRKIGGIVNGKNRAAKIERWKKDGENRTKKNRAVKK